MRDNIRVIEGGRTLYARDVQAAFADKTEAASVDTPDMAGFLIVVWDDQGMMATKFHHGQMSPYAPSLLPDIIRDSVRAVIHQ